MLQFDLNNKADQAEARHHNSKFFCKPSATNFKDAILESVKDVKLIQLSMDDAGVNWKMLKSLDGYLETKDPNIIVNIGSCTQNILHDALNTKYKHGLYPYLGNWTVY